MWVPDGSRKNQRGRRVVLWLCKMDKKKDGRKKGGEVVETRSSLLFTSTTTTEGHSKVHF